MLSPSSVRCLRPGRPLGSSLVIVATLGLALGATTAMVSVADALLVRAVPYRDSGALIAVTSAFPSIRLSGMNLSGPEALEFGRLTTVFSAAGPYRFTGLVVQGSGEAELGSGVQVSSGAARALDLRPFAGRAFVDDEYRPGGPAVAILGHGLWRRAFGADPRIIGRVVQLGGASREVVGVMPDGLTLLNRSVDVWLPLTLDPSDAGRRSDHGYNMVARLAPGKRFGDAVADVNRAMEIWRDETGELHVPTARMHPLELRPFTQATTGLNREPIGALLAAVVFLLLIACANVLNLLVARAERHRGELGIRVALGASRGRLLAESVTEGIALAAAGGLLGLAVAHGLIDVIAGTWPVAAAADLRLDYRTLGTASLAAFITGVVIGAVPIVRLDVARAGDWLKTGTRGSAGGPGRMRLLRGLIVLQVGVAVLLTAGAGLMLRSLMAMTAIDLGIDPHGVLRAQISLPPDGYPDDAQVWSFYDRTLERIRQVPGVTRAAVMSGLPPRRPANNTSFLLDGNELMDHSAIHQVEFVQHVSPDYFATLGIPLVQGRSLTSADDERATPAALVNETLARRFWPDTSPIGRRLKPAGDIGTWFTVVGVVADSRQDGIQSPVGSEIYVTHRQARRLMSGFMPRTMNLIVRSSGDLAPLAASTRATVRNLDSAAAVSGIAPMQEVVDRTIAQPRLLAWMFGAFAVLALVVAGVGVYGVTSYAVGARTSEFGVRLALGARPLDVLALVVRGGLSAVVVGITLGVGATLLGARLLRALLFGIEALDPVSVAGGAAVIAAAALVATILPAHRAARVDPLTAMRD